MIYKWGFPLLCLLKETQEDVLSWKFCEAYRLPSLGEDRTSTMASQLTLSVRDWRSCGSRNQPWKWGEAVTEGGCLMLFESIESMTESELVDTCTLLRITTCWRRWWKTIVKHGKTASRIHFLAWYFQVSSILIWPFGSKVPDWIYFFRCTGPPGGQLFFGVYWSPVSRQEIPGGAAKALPDRAKCGAAKAESLRTIGIKWRQKMATATTVGPKLQGH